MTIDSSLSKIRYIGNGVTTTFSIPFAYLTNNDGSAQLAVYVGDSDTPLVEGEDYTIVGLGQAVAIDDDVEFATYEERFDGGDVVFGVAPEQGVPVAVVRNVPQTQGVVFVEGEKFPAQDFENALDKLTMEVQEVKENLQRAIVLPPTSTEKPIEIRDEILEVSKQAKEKADEAVILVDEAKEIISQQTQEAVDVITTSTESAVSNISTKVDSAVGEINATAEQASGTVLENVEKSRIWAEGEQAEVQALGGELSSMGAADLAYAIANAPEDTPIDASGLFAMNVVKGPKGDKGDKGDDGKDGGGLEIGDVAFAVMGIDETKNLRRYLNGQVISQSQFVSFTNWVKERAKLYPNVVTTEENWQAEVTNSKLGQCGKFVIGEGTIRLPKVVNIQGLQDLALMGSIKAESLPNIKGFGGLVDGGGNNYIGESDVGCVEGAFYYDNARNGINGANYGTNASIRFDASRVSDAYQDNAPVQQEAIQYPYFIQVATGVEESVDVAREIELNNPFSLLDYKWSEYEITNASWLLSNGQFNSGATYISVYNLLLEIYNGTVTKDGVSVKLSTEAYTDTDFVINTTDTTFRLPIKVKLASGNAVVGNGRAVGLTSDGINVGTLSGSDSVGIYANGTNPPPVLPTGRLGDTNLESGRIGYGVTTDPTKSGIETSSSGLKLYFYVGETIQDANVIAASGVLSAVADGVRKSSATDRETVVGWGMPDYSAEVSLTLSTNDQSVITKGYIRASVEGITNATRALYINDISFGIGGSSANNNWSSCFIPVDVGTTYRVNVASDIKLTFYPCKGVN